nr:MAG TPA: hypothetical protein [Caudoviricetes sp.]
MPPTSIIIPVPPPQSFKAPEESRVDPVAAVIFVFLTCIVCGWFYIHVAWDANSERKYYKSRLKHETGSDLRRMWKSFIREETFLMFFGICGFAATVFFAAFLISAIVIEL